ncbi:hypothetical protein HPULCUR_001562 [Helicostylum pulchrum]|uniref:NAD-dependent protein deacetylase n=1 Tax=Helicostylum pulchrum TaxID=562976 RepID=A0ABP9XPW0_9FUNG
MSKTRRSKKDVLETPTIESIVKYIEEKNAKNIIVMSGAGISTAAGIPDFRSKDTGLYHNLQKFDLPYAEAVFDIEYFLEKPEPFYELAKELYPGKFYPTKTHYFIQLLQKKGLLLRNFTQNIDTLERLTGLDQEYIIEAHGSFATASCVECNERADSDMVREHALKGKVPRCESCDNLIKPDITFFGENLPKRFFDHLEDFEKADLLIVIGTSLQVQPFASLIDDVPDHIPRLLINMEKAGDHKSKSSGFDFKWKYGLNRDVFYAGTCDEGVTKMAKSLGWEKELNELYTNGNKKLKYTYAAIEPGEQEQDKEVDELADVLEKLTAKDDHNDKVKDDHNDKVAEDIKASESTKSDNVTSTDTTTTTTTTTSK